MSEGWTDLAAKVAEAEPHDALQERFYGLAFPIITVKFSGGVWRATMRRDSTLTVRAQDSYEGVDGAKGALPAVRKCWEKYLEERERGMIEAGLTPLTKWDEPSVMVPGDAKEGYVFTVVPAYFFGDSA